jgi:hypothetical protein
MNHDKIARLPRVMWKLGLIQEPDDKRAARRRSSTFYRRYRNNPAFPKPLGLPDGQLGWRESEIDDFISALNHTDDPRAGVLPVRPRHHPSGLPGSAAAPKPA